MKYFGHVKSPSSSLPLPSSSSSYFAHALHLWIPQLIELRVTTSTKPISKTSSEQLPPSCLFCSPMSTLHVPPPPLATTMGCGLNTDKLPILASGCTCKNSIVTTQTDHFSSTNLFHLAPPPPAWPSAATQHELSPTSGILVVEGGPVKAYGWTWHCTDDDRWKAAAERGEEIRGESDEGGWPETDNRFY